MSVLRRCLLSAVLLCGALPAATDFQIGPDTRLDSLAISAAALNYLVVYRDVSDPLLPRITGILVSNTGTVGTAFPVSDLGGSPLESPVQRGTVAFDGTNFLAVWADNRVAGFGIRGAFVSAEGALVGGDFLIAPASRNADLAPLVVFTGTDFFVAWQDDAQSASSAASQIYFARVSAAGLVSPVSSLPNAAQDQRLEFLAAGAGSEALIVFQDVAADPDETLATRINFDNSLSAVTSSTLLFRRDFSPTGYGAPVGAAFIDDEYVILSSYSAQIDSSVFKTRIRADGRVIRPSAPFAEVGQGKTGLSEDDFPRTVYNGNGEFFFVRNSQVSPTAYHLLAKRVMNDGFDRDPNVPLIDSASQGVLNGATAAALGSQYLVVWMDGRRGAFQPERQLNVYGLIVDGTKPGDETTPFLKAIARAGPIVGNSPLPVSFGTSGSTGIVDSVRWDFGDGGTSEFGSTSHTYESKGDYVAVLSIERAGYVVRDFARILVDSDAVGGGGGPPQVVGGSLGPVSAGVNTDIFVSNFSAALSFNTQNLDSLRVFGYLDPSVIPVSVKGVPVSLDVAARHYEFILKSDGTFFTAGGTKPAVRFSMNRLTGAFAVNVAQEDLAATFAALGAANETVAKPGKNIAVPVAFTFGTLNYSATITANSLASAGKSGRLSYLHATTGNSSSGFFVIFGTKVNENKATPKTHNFIVTGNTGFGGGRQLAKAASGHWRMSMGNFVQDVPVASIQKTGEVYVFKSEKVKSGINQFFYNARSGAFGISFKNIAAEGDDPSGMALSTSQFARADMAVSLDFDLEGGEKFQASGYLRLFRKKSTGKKWALR